MSRYPSGSGFQEFTGYTSGDLSQSSDWDSNGWANEPQVGTNELTNPTNFTDGAAFVSASAFDTTGIDYCEAQLTAVVVGGAGDGDYHVPAIFNGTDGDSHYTIEISSGNVIVAKWVNGSRQEEGSAAQAVSSGDIFKITVEYDTPSAGQNTITVYIDEGSGFSEVTSAVDDGSNFGGTTVFGVGQPGVFYRRQSGQSSTGDDFAASSVVDGIENGGAADILFVVNDAVTIDEDNSTFHDWLAHTLGHNVEYIDDADAEPGGGYDLVIISESVSSSAVGTKYNAREEPVMLMERALADAEFDFSTTYSEGTSEDVDVVGSHWIAADSGLSGTIDLGTGGASDDTQWLTGTLAGGLVSVAEDGSSNPVVAAFESGSAKQGGGEFAERRVFFGINEEVQGSLSTDGKALMESAIRWLLYQDRVSSAFRINRHDFDSDTANWNITGDADVSNYVTRIIVIGHDAGATNISEISSATNGDLSSLGTDASGSACALRMYSETLNGTEHSEAITITLSVAQGGFVWEILTNTPEADLVVPASVFDSGSTSPNPPSATGLDSGETYDVLAIMYHDNGAEQFDSGPSGYQPAPIGAYDYNNYAGGGGSAVFHDQVSGVTSEDPGAFTLDNSRANCTATIALQGAAEAANAPRYYRQHIGFV